ncbi:MAG: MarR family transcriptional regulator [Thiobacillaceae bacterium]|nr:MarR family transcriptional regulator [Thiobacillaceae bacterium]MDW8322931.1 MarR family transcriptional regulator [Burkholderiales bacterium]
MSEALAAEALRQFRLIYGAVRKHSREMERACGVGGAQVWALAVLARSPGLRVTELAQRLSIHPSTASNLLDKLERAGYVRRSRQAQDQRVVELSLTEAGRALLARAPQPWSGVLTHALEQLPEASLQRLVADLREVTGRLQVADARAAGKPLTEL